MTTARLHIDASRREANKRAHTATHLLHARLIGLFPQTHQAGSYVGPDELRFDFVAERMLTDGELAELTQNINDFIAQGQQVMTRELPYQEALQSGAKAFFEEKYPETVRVVSIPGTRSAQDVYSLELCGGTHVDNTAHIGAFIVTEQTSIAASTRRIVALT